MVSKVLSQYETSMARQIGEAIQIGLSDPNSLMNSKAEWGGNRIPRVTIDNEEEGGRQGRQNGVLQPLSQQRQGVNQTGSEPSSFPAADIRESKKRKFSSANSAVIPSAGIRAFLVTNRPSEDLGMNSRARQMNENPGLTEQTPRRA